MKIETLAIKDLTLDPQNARQHDPKNLKAIEGSLAQFGQRKPIVITEANVIVAGNGTVTAAKNLGWEKIEAVRVPADWSQDQVKAFALADNRTAELATWAPEVLAAQLIELESAGFEIADFGFDKIEPEIDPDSLDEDEIPEPPAEPVTKLGDLWQLGRHRLLCGDSTDMSTVQRLTDGNQADMVFTDPPYGISHSGKGITGDSQANDFGQILGDGDVKVATKSFELCQDLFPKATQIWWGANYYSESIPNGFGWLIWDKDRVGDTFSGAELAFVNYGIKVNVFRHTWHGMIKASERGEKRVHPTQKPVALVDYCFKTYGNPATVIDLFGGSGSTLIAAEQSDKSAYLMEFDPKYCDVIIKRWENLTGQKAELVNANR
jgi:DNA modification methylase